MDKRCSLCWLIVEIGVNLTKESSSQTMLKKARPFASTTFIQAKLKFRNMIPSGVPFSALL